MIRLPALGRVFLGEPLRRIENGDKSLYLSFDDGPDPETTPQVLSLLKEFGAKATFFVVAERAKAQPALIKRILSEGHSIGNHSADHRYQVFFQGYGRMRSWIEHSERELKSLGVQSVGFRPPVGIRTPELIRALRDLGLPLILWNQRSFDGILKFTPQKARRLAQAANAGDIVLLHDRQRSAWRDSFLKGLGQLLEDLGRKGYSLPKLDPVRTNQAPLKELSAP